MWRKKDKNNWCDYAVLKIMNVCIIILSKNNINIMYIYTINKHNSLSYLPKHGVENKIFNVF